MRRVAAIGCGLVLWLGLIAPASAAPARVHVPVLTTHVQSVQFRLSVAGSNAGSTYWVAYGPLAGRFGIVRLHAVGPGLFGATAQLPAGRTIYAYLSGRGTVQTPAGLEPGNPVVTVKRLGPLPVRGGLMPMVHWAAPIG